ncbi:MAG TPA: prepilin-type N-terminal cleavage/methylation domain-containing protein [Polyangiaceae bacterium]|jgi:general secretion pathway protein H|nr:prepilin-type N-terminal cleavage/methylation domain-containing protein [Polyangiaceae bacterium]
MKASAAQSSNRGMTLFEVLIVVTLIALLGGTVLMGSGMLGSSRLRSAATLIVASIRLASTRANTMGKPTRLVFDFDTKTLSLEEASSSKMLRDKKAPAGGAAAATEAEKAAKAEAERILDGPQAPKSSFSPVASFTTDAEDPSKGRTLGAGVDLVAVQTDHDEDPVTSGRAYLYFWPGGVTERGHVQLKRQGAEGGLTVTVSSLTGRATVVKGLVDLPSPRSEDEEDQGERDEE